MDAKAFFKESYNLSAHAISAYVSDLTDADLLLTPGPDCNCLAWQLGHLISSEHGLLNSVVPGAAPQLPEGFDAKHSKDNSSSTDASDYLTKEGYLELFSKMKTATFAAIDSLSETDLDKPAPEHLRSFLPSVGSVFMLIAMHGTMHSGQFVPVRRALKKPIVI